MYVVLCRLHHLGPTSIVSFLDDFTRKTLIYLIKKKCEVIEVFKLKRTYGGGEYVSAESRCYGKKKEYFI